MRSKRAASERCPRRSYVETSRSQLDARLQHQAVTFPTQVLLRVRLDGAYISAIRHTKFEDVVHLNIIPHIREDLLHANRPIAVIVAMLEVGTILELLLGR